MLTIIDYDTPSPKTQYLVIDGVRNSWESWEKSDSEYRPGTLHTRDSFYLGPKDRDLCERLIRLGSDERKFMRQLHVVIKLRAPELFYKQFDTYKVGTTRNSTSTMHTAGRETLVVPMFSFEDVPDDSVRIILGELNQLRDRWIESGRHKGPEERDWRAVLATLPMGFDFLSTWDANYEVLRAMFWARQKHRLYEWRQFCDFLTTLPHAHFITMPAEKPNPVRDQVRALLAAWDALESPEEHDVAAYERFEDTKLDLGDQAVELLRTFVKGSS